MWNGEGIQQAVDAVVYTSRFQYSDSVRSKIQVNHWDTPWSYKNYTTIHTGLSQYGIDDRS